MPVCISANTNNSLENLLAGHVSFAKTSVSETVQTTHGLDLPKNMVKLFDLPNTLRDKLHLVNIMITIWQHFFMFIFSFFETLWFPLSKNKLIGGLG